MPKPATYSPRLPWQDGVPQTPRSMQPRRTASASVDGTNSPPKRRTGGKHRRTAADAPLQPPAFALTRSPASAAIPLPAAPPVTRALTLSPLRLLSPLNPPCTLCAQINLLLHSEKFLRVFRELFSKSSLNGARGGAPTASSVRLRPPPARILPRCRLLARIPSRPSAFASQPVLRPLRAKQLASSLRKVLEGFQGTFFKKFPERGPGQRPDRLPAAPQ